MSTMVDYTMLADELLFEERWGLYEAPASIDRRDQWDQLLADKGCG